MQAEPSSRAARNSNCAFHRQVFIKTGPHIRAFCWHMKSEHAVDASARSCRSSAARLMPPRWAFRLRRQQTPGAGLAGKGPVPSSQPFPTSLSRLFKFPARVKMRAVGKELTQVKVGGVAAAVEGPRSAQFGPAGPCDARQVTGSDEG